MEKPNNGLNQPTNFIKFPNDEFTPAGITSFQTANIVSVFNGKKTEPKLSVRFLFSNGEARKWTNFMTVAYAGKKVPNLVKLFSGVSELSQRLTDDDWIFNTGFKIILEASGEYQNILRVKVDTSVDTSTFFYDAKFVPYKTVRAWAQHAVPLLEARCKLKNEDGTTNIKVFTPAEFVEKEEETDE